jgi:hypothetical protein
LRAAGDGSVYIADATNNVVWKVDTGGTIHRFAGRADGSGGFGGDGGPATQSTLNNPEAVTPDGAGNVYIADSGNHMVRMVDTTGVITTVAGNGNWYTPSPDNVPATQVSLSGPEGVAIEPSGALLLSDWNRIRRVQGGIITTVSGSGGSEIIGIAVDQQGNIYYADPNNNEVRIAGSGASIAGNGTSGYSGDGGPATAAQLAGPYDVAVDAGNNIYIADWGNNRVREVTGGVIRTIAGNGKLTAGDGGPATQAQISIASKVAFDSHGNYYFAILSDNVVKKVDTSGRITTVAGNGNGGFGGDGGPATAATLWEPGNVAVDRNDNLYIVDERNNRIRLVAPNTGIITTVAGGGSALASNVPATQTALSPTAVAFDSAGNWYIADQGFELVRKVDSNGIITTVAGGNTTNDPGDGSVATNAFIGRIYGIAFDASDNLFIADTANHSTIRRVDHVTQIITTVAGQSFKPGYGGDGGPATSAYLNGPRDVTVDANGNLLIADTMNHRVRQVDTNGTITTVAGNGQEGCQGDGGPATSAQLSGPFGVTVDAASNQYISGMARVRMVSAGSPPTPTPTPTPSPTPTPTATSTATPTPTPAPPSAWDTVTRSSTQQYRLSGSDGASWADIDPGGALTLSLKPQIDSTAIITGNADLWTADAGVNQDLAVTVDGGVAAWKESGGFAGTFSPNAAAVQAIVPMAAGSSHSVSLRWKTNTPAPGKTIFAGAGPWPGAGVYSPTTITARLVPAVQVRSTMRTTQLTLANNDGVNFESVDAATPIALEVKPLTDGVALVTGNADLWTQTAGINQDLGIKVAELNPGIVAWKESGGFAGTYSPNAAMVQGAFNVLAGQTYHVSLVWKANQVEHGAVIHAGAGPLPDRVGSFSPTRLTVQVLPVSSSSSVRQARQFSLSNVDGASFYDLQLPSPAGGGQGGGALTLALPASSDCLALISGNADLWTAHAGINQDFGISVDGTIVAWKESGGFAGTFSPNAAYVQALVPVHKGQSPQVRLEWKTNRPVPAGQTIYAGAGPWPASGGDYSTTTLIAQLVSCSY